MTDGDREKSIVLDYEAISSVVSDNRQAFIVTSVDSSNWFCITSFGYEAEEETDCTEPLAGKHIGYPKVDVIEGKAKLFSEWTTDDQTQQGWFLLEQTDRGWELVNEQQTTDKELTGEILQRERSFTKDGKVYWFTEEPGLSSFVFPTSEGSELTIHHESLANVINGSLISFTMDGDVIHCVSAREKPREA